MRFRLAVASLALVSAATQSHAQSWYWWCDALNAGYPWVRTCPTPWRLVTPNSPMPQRQAPSYGATPPPAIGNPAPRGAGPPPIAATAPVSPSSREFQEGQADRRAWEAWFNGQSGDYRNGAEYWAAHRSLRNPGSCMASPPSTGASWTAGCSAAQEKLTPSDTRRRTEPEYRLGWNDPGPLTSLPAAIENAGTPGAQGEVPAPSATEVQPTSSASSASQSPAPQQLLSPAASSVPSPAAAESSSGNNTPAPSQASDNGLLIFIAIVVTGGGVWVIWKRYQYTARRRREEEALRIVASEVDFHAPVLRVKRIQTVLRDAYGTPSIDKWNKEKEYYIQTRVLPALQAGGLDDMYGPLAVTIETMIELAAERPITPASDIGSEFISNPEVFDPRMNPIDYEQHCALQLEKAGWSTRLTPATGDQGADVIANRAGKVLVLQCKLYGSPVGNEAVQQVIAAQTFQSADVAAVVSNQEFTRSAKQLADVSGVHLLHHEQLVTFVG
jgi:hypothetical protein